MLFNRIFKKKTLALAKPEAGQMLLKGEKIGDVALENIVFYIENGTGAFESTLKQNYIGIQELFKERNLILFYYPAFKEDKNHLHSLIRSFLNYNYPYLSEQVSEKITAYYHQLLNSTDENTFYFLLVQTFSLPFPPQAVLYRNVNSDNFSSFELTTDTDLNNQIEYYLSRIKFYSEDCYYQLADETNFNDPEDAFEVKAQIISKEIHDKIEFLRLNGQYKTLFTLMTEIANKLAEIGIPQEKLIDGFGKKLTYDIKLSRILVDQHYRIILPDFNNIEISLPPLTKAVYILFLSHPEGIMLKNLIDYKLELINIYNKITNLSDQGKINDSIGALLDATNNSIHEKCSRIKGAFISSMNDFIASHYYVTGERGAPKKISLPNDLIHIVRS